MSTHNFKVGDIVFVDQLESRMKKIKAVKEQFKVMRYC